MQDNGYGSFSVTKNYKPAKKGTYKPKPSRGSSSSGGSDTGYGHNTVTRGYKPKSKPKSDKPKQTQNGTRTWGTRDEGYGHVPRTGGNKHRSAAEKRVQQKKDIPTLYRERLNKNKPDNPNRYDEAMQGYRRQRQAIGAHQGHYYGPDEFKGNLRMVDAWRKEGSQDPKKWLKGMSKRKRQWVAKKGYQSN